VSSALDLGARAAVADPFGVYARLRADEPVRHLPDADVWQVSRYEDVVAAAADPRRFSSRETNGYERRRLNVLVGTDPPEHTRLRRLAARALSPRRLDALAPRVDAIATARVDAFADGGGGDAVAQLAEPIACEVHAALLGLDPEGLAARRAGHGMRPDPRAAWRRFFLEAIGARRRAPEDDLITTLLEPAADGERLTEDELVAFLGLMLAAGVNTSRDLVANLLAELAARPAQWERLVAEPALVASAVEEGLRYTSAIQAMYRTSTRDVDVAGTTIPAGSRVMLLFGSANRDDRRWRDAERFDVGRYADGIAKGGAHVAFGAGPHACPGGSLARRIARRVLTELLRHEARPHLTGRPRYGRNPCFRSLEALPLGVTGGEE
jgi:cytochrome P450